MDVIDQDVSDRYAIYNGDSCEVLKTLPAKSVGLSIYSPPFADLYNYSSSDRDLSNCRSYDEFLEHYGFVVGELARLTMPGRLSCVHCTDIPIPGQKKGYRDFPGDIIRLHLESGFHYHGRVSIWKEPFRVALRTRLQGLMHRTLVKDSTLCSVANGDTLLLFRRHGENPVPVVHPTGLTTYAGDREVPQDVLANNLTDLETYDGAIPQAKNRLSQWIWRQYASCFWDDIRIDRVLPYRESREPDDEKHVCPLQLDVIDRAVILWSNPGETVLTPFMGVGSEVYGAVTNGRKGVGIELKAGYYKQAQRNVRAAVKPAAPGLFDGIEEMEVGAA